MNIDESRTTFIKFKTEYEKFKLSDLTEADTRSKILDYLLTKVLGWTEEQIDREKYVQVGYYDYLISIPGFQFTIEAKKNFVEFKLPAVHKRVTINSLIKGNKDVIQQIRSYMFEVGIQFGVISNGRQFIIGKFINTDGSDWKKNKCLIFNGIEDIENRFIEFYNSLSKKSVIENGLLPIENLVVEQGRNIYSSITNKNEEIVRNSLSSEFTPVLDRVFGEIYKYEVLDNERLINECFVENKEIKKNKSDIEKIFGDKPPTLSEVSGARNTSSIINQISNEIENQPIGLRDIQPPHPILIIGSKGAGKTTFINYLFKTALEDRTLKNRPFVYMDFRKYVDEDLLTNSPKIYKDIISKIHEDYEGLNLYSIKILKRIYFREIKEKTAIWSIGGDETIFNENLKKFLDESTKDYENHFIKMSHFFLSERSKRLTLVIDNADQFGLEVQKKVFLFAHSINRKAKCSIVLSLREGYYYEWRNKPPFDAFINNVYHITAPPYSEVLQKRIDYALRNIKLEGTTKGSYGEATFELNNKSVKNFLQGLKKSLFGRENSEMLQFLEETTYPNLREGLKAFRDFLLSGHTKVAQYILRQQVDPNSTNIIPFWEFLKAIALLNRKYFNHNKSSIHNIFSPSEGNSFIFLKIKILRFLLTRIESFGQAEKFIQTESLISHFTKKGFKFSTIIDELNELNNFRLIETDDSSSDKEFNTELNNNKNISISLKGRYYIKVLLIKVSYLELCLQDTPIYSGDHFTKIRESFPLSNSNGKRPLSERHKNLLLFIEYLKDRERIEMANNNVINYMRENGLTKGLNRVKRTVDKLNRQRN